MTDGFSAGTIFGVSFLGALFAIVASLLLVYTYVSLRLVPKIKRSFRAWIHEIGHQALLEQGSIDSAELLREIGAPHASYAPWQAGAPRVVFTCEDHGRCAGCPRVLAQFEAIVRHQGEDSLDEVERTCYARLRAQLADDGQIVGESEADRQKRIAFRVVDALVREGVALSRARGAVWATGKDDRATFAGWLSAARMSCQQADDGTPKEDVA